MSRKINDIILVVDVEATCWAEHNSDNGLRTRIEPVSEIVEVGVCELNRFTLEITNPKSIPIKPIFSTCSEFCTQLTRWDDEKLKYAGTFHDACGILDKEYNSRNIPWASWGDYDRMQFERDCEHKITWRRLKSPLPDSEFIETVGLMPTEEDLKSIGGILYRTLYPFGRTHINIKSLFNILRQKGRECGVSEALKEVGLEFEGRPHSGIDDSYNIARIFSVLIEESN